MVTGSSWWRSGAAASVAMIGLVACGGGGSAMSEEDFRDSVGEICDDVTAELDDLGEPADFAELATIGKDAKAIVEDAIADLGDLEAPDDLADDFDEWLDLKKDQADLYDDIIAAAEDEDQAALEDVTAEISDIDAEANALAEDLGIDECISEDRGETPTTDVPTTDGAVSLPPQPTSPPVTDGTTTPASGVNAYGLSEQFAPFAGYTFEDLSPEQLDDLATQLTSDPALAGLDEVAGADLVSEASGESEGSIIVVYDEAGIEGTDAESAMLSFALGLAGGTPEEITTPGGRTGTSWVDDDGDEQLLVFNEGIAVWVLGYTSGYPDFDVAATFDAFIDANAG